MGCCSQAPQTGAPELCSSARTATETLHTWLPVTAAIASVGQFDVVFARRELEAIVPVLCKDVTPACVGRMHPGNASRLNLEGHLKFLKLLSSLNYLSILIFLNCILSFLCVQLVHHSTLCWLDCLPLRTLSEP
jgi:hypothetical protein